MRIRIGNVHIELERGEDPAQAFKGLMRKMGNKELGDLLGVSERTVRRWKDSGELPGAGRQVSMMELLAPDAGEIGQELFTGGAITAMGHGG